MLVTGAQGVHDPQGHARARPSAQQQLRHQKIQNIKNQKTPHEHSTINILDFSQIVAKGDCYPLGSSPSLKLNL